eukprot:scaffold6171_cov83-Skeletonema_dohrnii-CCMP3373.AAC.1
MKEGAGGIGGAKKLGVARDRRQDSSKKDNGGITTKGGARVRCGPLEGSHDQKKKGLCCEWGFNGMRYLLTRAGTGLLLRTRVYLQIVGTDVVGSHLFFTRSTTITTTTTKHNNIMMASRDNDIDKETLSESETSSNQDQGQGESCDRKGAGDGKPRTSNIETNGVDSAAKKEGAPRKSHKRSGSKRNDINKVSKVLKLKRRRRNKPLKRCIIPEARVIQAYNERAYISEHEHDGDNGEYQAQAVICTVRVPEWLQQKIQQRRQKKMKNMANKNGGGKSHRARCHCFDCF